MIIGFLRFGLSIPTLNPEGDLSSAPFEAKWQFDVGLLRAAGAFLPT